MLSEAVDDAKVSFIKLMPSLVTSMIDANFCETNLSTQMINTQIDVLRSMQMDCDESRRILFTSSLNALLAFCLKFNFYSLELLLLVYTKGLVDAELSLNSLLPGLHKDLFLMYAGLCDFKK